MQVHDAKVSPEIPWPTHQGERTDLIKKQTREVFTVYGRDFKTEYDAMEYAYTQSYHQLDVLLKDLDHKIGRKGIQEILKHDNEFLHKLADAIQEHRNMCILKELHRPIEVESKVHE